MTTENSDHQQRTLALDPAQSFIVQAPAGSGKTELLTQRYLTLLAHVHHPEEILALTFTRKAAGEMRHRIIHALQQAASLPEPNAPHAQRTWQLASKALKNDQQRHWNLLINPTRLRIQTIDALCSSLVQHMPMLATNSIKPNLTTQPEPYYREATVQLFANLAAESQPCCQQALQKLLLYWDNQIDKLQQHFIDLLARREQWLPYLFAAQQTPSLRDYLEQGLVRITTEILQTIAATLPCDLHDELIILLKFAAEQKQALATSQEPNHNTAWLSLDTLPPATIDYCDAWHAIAELLLTQTGQWRRQITKNIGFPAPSSAKNAQEKSLWQTMKQDLQNLLERLSSEETLRVALANLFTRPAWHYHEEQWQIIEALVHLLPKLAAELKIIFCQQKISDFAEVTAEALVALGSEENPTDLALYLDHKISHLLVDEFQDTSIQQFNLLTKLTAGWDGDDGRTLFLVGDPMQSIYRFRQAEVGLFLRARQQGLGPCQLHSLTLNTNFRSTPELVSWFNQTFPTIFPRTEDIATGAIRYTPSQAAPLIPHLEKNSSPLIPPLQKGSSSLIPPLQKGSSSLIPPLQKGGRGDFTTPTHHHLFHTKTDETQHILTFIPQQLAAHPNTHIAILVRSRTQLVTLLPALKQANIAFNAVELEALKSRPIIQDLWALTRALIHLADRVAWLSILRAPWCGLTLTDLHALVSPNTEATIASCLRHYEQRPLSADGQLRLRHTASILLHALQHRTRGRLRQHIEQTWRALGGSSYIKSNQEWQDVHTFFDLLESAEQGGELLDSDQFIDLIEKCYLTTGDPNARLHLMTIHKAKGLQFDIVILPGLEQVNRSKDSPLLMWLERPNLEGNNDVLIAPIKAAEQSHDSIYSYLRQIDSQKYDYENVRLLYVAATRARQQLHLLATFSPNEQNEWPTPRRNSFLSLLWPQQQHHFTANLQPQTNQAETTQAPLTTIPTLHRLPSTWFTTQEIFSYSLIPPFEKGELGGISLGISLPALIGTLIHEQLYRLGTLGIQHCQLNDFYRQEAHWQQRLRSAGFTPQEITHSIQTIKVALTNVFQDTQHHWIFEHHHRQNHCEYSVTTHINDQYQTLIIDRTFIDDQNTRWIIDYKTNQPNDNEALSEFLAKEKLRHTPQLNQYATALNSIPPSPSTLKIALYYPLIPTCLAWEWEKIN